MRARRAPRIRPLVAAALALAAAILLAGCTASADEDPLPAAPIASPDAPPTSPADAVDDAFVGSIAAAESGGSRPQLSWPEVEGAALYRVAVVQDDGPGWAWSGGESRVVLGGGAEGRVGPGFALSSPGTAYVIAVSADGAVLDTGVVALAGP